MSFGASCDRVALAYFVNSVEGRDDLVVDVDGRVNEVDDLTWFRVVYDEIKIDRVHEHDGHLAEQLAYRVWLHSTSTRIQIKLYYLSVWIAFCITFRFGELSEREALNTTAFYFSSSTTWAPSWSFPAFLSMPVATNVPELQYMLKAYQSLWLIQQWMLCEAVGCVAPRLRAFRHCHRIYSNRLDTDLHCSCLR